ncbi:MAG: GDSL-type esterase/lipase family protein [Myxococcota bacterium]
MRVLALPLLLAACTGADPEDTDDPGYPVDPDVATWVPEAAPFDQVERVLFFGDSITAGYGMGQLDNAYTRLLVENSDAWPTFDGNDLTTRYGDLEVLNASVSGSQTEDVIDRQIPFVEDQLGAVLSGPTLVFITIGGNDLTNALVTPGAIDTVADDIEERMDIITSTLTDPARFPDGVYLLATNVYEPTDGEGQADQCFFGLDVARVEPVLDDVNARTLAMAQERGFAWVDLRAHFRGHGWNSDDASIAAYDEADPTLWLQSDCIHPNKRGHHEIRRLFLAAADGLPLPAWIP